LAASDLNKNWWWSYAENQF